MNNVEHVDWYSDSPVEHQQYDLLGRGEFIDSLESILDKLRSSERSSVLALIGSWGSGKSSVLDLLSRRIAEKTANKPQWIQVDFNPWYYQDLVSLQIGFFREIHSALPSGRSWRKARKEIANLGKSVAPLGSLLSFVGVNASVPINGIAGMIEGDQGVVSQQKKVEKTLQKAGVPVLVVVDDVDRLDPSELLLLFKLIRHVGRIDNVHYLLAYDERTLIDALGRTGLVGSEDPRRAIDYLEKIIQVRLDIPPIRKEQLSKWVDARFTHLAQEHNVDLTEETTRRFSNAYFGHLGQRLNTPRAIKRYFAQTDSFLAAISQEVDFVDFLIISWFRAAEPLLYRGIIAHREQLLGEFSALSEEIISAKKDAAAAKRYWENVLISAKVDSRHIEGVADLIGQLFPRFKHQWDMKTYSNEGGRKKLKRVAHPDYFDRYFAFAVPEEDLSDQLVQKAYQQIVNGSQGEELATIESSLSDRASLIFEKLESWTSPGSAESVEITKWLIRNFYRLPKHVSIADAQQRARWFGCRLYVALDESMQMRVLEEAKLSVEGLRYFSYLSNAAVSELREQRDASGQEITSDVDRHFAERIALELKDQGKVTTPFEIDKGLWALVTDWIRIDLPAAKSWVMQGLTEQHWPVIDLAGRFVSTLIPLGVQNPIPKIGDFDSDNFAKIVDLELLETDPSLSLEDSNIVLAYDTPATNENRRLVARKELAKLIARRSAGRGQEQSCDE